MKLSVVIPTYWSRPLPEPWQPGDLVFDHPSPLGTSGQLGRLLDSMSMLKVEDAEVILLVVPTAPDIDEDVVRHVRLIVSAKRRSLPIRLLTPASLQRLGERLSDDVGSWSDLLSLSSYGHVRNACLLAGALIGAEAAVLIDDDEIFELPDFLNTVRAGLNARFDGKPTRILAGWYMNADGGYRLDKPLNPWSRSWPENQTMDRAFEQYIGGPGRYVRTSFAFGGNLSIHRDVFSNVPFDIGITRGEDIDYLLMARMLGIDTVLDNALHIRHLPPPKSHPTWLRQRQDALRFSRERAKILAADKMNGLTPVAPEDLDPYPGFFLRNDLPDRISRTASELAQHYRGLGEDEYAREAERTPELCEDARQDNLTALAEWLSLREKWKQLMVLLEDQDFSDILESADA